MNEKIWVFSKFFLSMMWPFDGGVWSVIGSLRLRYLYLCLMNLERMCVWHGAIFIFVFSSSQLCTKGWTWFFSYQKSCQILSGRFRWCGSWIWLFWNISDLLGENSTKGQLIHSSWNFVLCWLLNFKWLKQFHILQIANCDLNHLQC